MEYDSIRCACSSYIWRYYEIKSVDFSCKCYPVGTPLLGGAYQKDFSSSSSSYEYLLIATTRSESERCSIYGKLLELEDLQKQFDRAVPIGYNIYELRAYISR